MARGIALIVTHDEKYADYAIKCVKSIREAGRYDGDIVVFSDIPESLEKIEANVIFSRTVLRNGYGSREIKTTLPHRIPFDTTLYLDVDIICCSPFENLWKYAEKGDLWMVRDSARWPAGITPPYPPNILYANAGLILFDCCNKEWRKTKTNDQPPLARVQMETKIVPKELPEIYNSKRPKENQVFIHYMGQKEV
jgi:hypothetical protein